jgi:hypothetical protein
MLGTPMPADISKRVYSDYGPDLAAADNNVLVLVRDAARLAHVPPKEQGLLLLNDMSPYCISGLQREGKCEFKSTSSRWTCLRTTACCARLVPLLPLLVL